MTSPPPKTSPQDPEPAAATAPLPAKPPKAVERPHPLTGVARSWIVLIGMFVFAGREFLEKGLTGFTELGYVVWFVGGIMLLALLLNLGFGIVDWLTTSFVADEEEFRIERNFLSRNSTRISYAKIQAVDISRSLPARLLGLSAVKIDIGGDGGEKLEFLGKERAETLRDHLLAHMKSLSEPPGTAAAEPLTEPSPELAEVFRLKPGTLLLGVLVSKMLPGLLLGVAYLVVMLATVSTPGSLASGGLLLGLVGYLWSEIAGNWNFKISRSANGLRLQHGLLNTESQSLKPDRIQAVSIHQDFLQRLTGLYRIRVTVLGFDGSEEKLSGRFLPFGTWEDVTRTLHEIWPEVDLSAIELHGQPPRARWLTPLGFKRHQWGTDQRVLLAHHGWLDHTITVVPHHRMQSVSISQGPLQRALRLASIEVHTTPGPVSLELYHLADSKAREVFVSQLPRARGVSASKPDPDIPPPSTITEQVPLG